MAFAAMLIGNGLCLVIGALWLAGLVGFEKALALGVTPFIVGGVLKSALAAATLRLFPRAKTEQQAS
jgi:biotin transport system substrate-specific component